MKRNLTLTLLLALFLLPWQPARPQGSTRYQVAVCDWMMLKRQKAGALTLARAIGADGVEVDMGPLGRRELFDNQLRDKQAASRFRGMADSLGVKVPSMAMSGFFAQNLLRRSNHRDLMLDCLATMQALGSGMLFLPLGGSGQAWQQRGAERDSMVAVLRLMGDMAYAHGVRIGIRTGGDARFDKRLLRDIRSRGVGIYYNLQDAADAHRDICKELRRLGAKRIVQIHASNTDSVNLPEDQEIDLPAIRRTLDRMGWRGWLVVERSRDVNRVRDVKYNFGRNVAYLKEVFENR